MWQVAGVKAHSNGLHFLLYLTFTELGPLLHKWCTTITAAAFATMAAAWCCCCELQLALQSLCSRVLGPVGKIFLSICACR
jgi:hypothetical protein